MEQIKSMAARLNVGHPLNLNFRINNGPVFNIYLIYLQMFTSHGIWLFCVFTCGTWHLQHFHSLQSFGYISNLYKGTEEFHTESRDIIFFASAQSPCCLLLQVETWGFVDSPSIYQNTDSIAAKHFCWEISQKELSLVTPLSASLDCCYAYTCGEENAGNGIIQSFPQALSVPPRGEVVCG